MKSTLHLHIQPGPPVREVICFYSGKKTQSSKQKKRFSAGSGKRRPSLQSGSLVYHGGDLTDDETWSEETEEEGPHLLDSTSNEENQLGNCLEDTETMPFYTFTQILTAVSAV